MQPPPPTRIGLSGTGFIARGIAGLLAQDPARYTVTAALTRRAPSEVAPMPGGVPVTDAPGRLIEGADVIVECSGTVGGAARVVAAALEAGLPVLTMNAEFQLTLGPAFHGRGRIDESRGDQPGSIAALAEEARLMGFRPLVYGSQKGFLNPDPTPDEMAYWARRSGISLAAVTAFTDGTKVQIEQALVANALGAGIARRNLLGPAAEDLAAGAEVLAEAAAQAGGPLSDYVLQPGGAGDVFVLATHPGPPEALRYYKLGEGPHYLLRRPYHLGHLEVPLSLSRLVEGRAPLMPPAPTARVSVAAVAKRDLPAGTRIERAMGSFDLRGEAVVAADAPGHCPIGLLDGARLTRPVARGETLALDGVELADAGALALWQAMAKG